MHDHHVTLEGQFLVWLFKASLALQEVIKGQLVKKMLKYIIIIAKISEILTFLLKNLSFKSLRASHLFQTKAFKKIFVNLNIQLISQRFYLGFWAATSSLKGFWQNTHNIEIFWIGNDSLYMYKVVKGEKKLLKVNWWSGLFLITSPGIYIMI